MVSRWGFRRRVLRRAVGTLWPLLLLLLLLLQGAWRLRPLVGVRWLGSMPTRVGSSGCDVPAFLLFVSVASFGCNRGRRLRRVPLLLASYRTRLSVVVLRTFSIVKNNRPVVFGKVAAFRCGVAYTEVGLAGEFLYHRLQLSERVNGLQVHTRIKVLCVVVSGRRVSGLAAGRR